MSTGPSGEEDLRASSGSICGGCVTPITDLAVITPDALRASRPMAGCWRPQARFDGANLDALPESSCTSFPDTLMVSMQSRSPPTGGFLPRR